MFHSDPVQKGCTSPSLPTVFVTLWRTFGEALHLVEDLLLLCQVVVRRFERRLLEEENTIFQIAFQL